MNNTDIVYNRAKGWQLGMFALNNTSTNMALMLMGYFALFTQNVLGLSAVIIGVVVTSMRIFDGITDPIIGFFIDKTDGKFGKFRPYMVIGCLIICISTIAIFRCPQSFSITGKYIYTVGWYIIYILGYTCQTACTKGAQAALTNDPKQRPVFSMFNAVYNVVATALMTWLLTNYLASRYEKSMVDPELWKTASIIFSLFMIFLTVLAVIGIAEKDQTKYFGLGKAHVVKFRDYAPILKNNRPLQMLIIASSTDKFALMTNRAVQTYLYANLFLNVSLAGTFSTLTMIPMAVLLVILISFARKSGQKKIFVIGTWVSFILLCIMYLVGAKPETSYIFLGILFLQRCAAQVASNVVNTMVADCADYETWRTGRFVPGMIGTAFSFVDKLISSLAGTVWGIMLGVLGLATTVLTPNVFISDSFNAAVMFCFCGFPILGHIASIIAMKYYVLDKEMMEKVQRDIADRKAGLGSGIHE